jgi:hypothetical protein
MKLMLVIFCGLTGMVIAYFAGVIVACDWLYPGSNLCGIYGVFLTAPIGLVIGLVVGRYLSKR